MLENSGSSVGRALALQHKGCAGLKGSGRTIAFVTYIEAHVRNNFHV